MANRRPCCEEWSPENEVVDERSGDCICTMCGLVLEGCMMLEGWMDGERSAVPDEAMGLGTTIERVKGVRQSVLAQSHYGGGHARKKAMAVVNRLGSVLALSDRTMGYAREMMTDVLSKKATSKMEVLAAGCLYFACKVDGVDRGEVEVADALGLDRRALQKVNKKLRGVLADRPYARAMLHGVRPASLVPRMLQGLMGMTDSTNGNHRAVTDIRKRVMAVCDAVEQGCYLEGRKPQSVCAAMIALVMRDRPTSDIACVCGVSVGALEASLIVLQGLVKEKKISV